jgi:hypothetical protein
VSTGDILWIILGGTVAVMVLMLWLALCINWVTETMHRQMMEVLRAFGTTARHIDLDR